MVKIMVIAFGLQKLVNVIYEYCFFNTSIIDGLSKISVFQIAIIVFALLFVISSRGDESSIGIYVGLANCLAVYSVRALTESLVITNLVLHRVLIVLAVTMITTIALKIILESSFDFYSCMFLVYILKFVSYFNLLGYFGIYVYECQALIVSVFQALLGWYLYNNKCELCAESDTQVMLSGKKHNKKERKGIAIMVNSVMRFVKDYLIYNAVTVGIINIVLQAIFFLYSYCILLQPVKDGIMSNVMECTSYNLISIGVMW